MKMKITPARQTVHALMSNRIIKERSLLEDDQSSLAKLTSSELKIHNPYQETEARNFRAAIKRREQFIADREDELELMKSHEAPRVLVEIDI